MPNTCLNAVPGLALGLVLASLPLAAPAQSLLPAGSPSAINSGSAGLFSPALELDGALQQEIRSALAAMADSDLSLTYARIHHAFRQTLGMDDLSAARRLVDYAALAETELDRRAIPHPAGTGSAAQMGVEYELVL